MRYSKPNMAIQSANDAITYLPEYCLIAKVQIKSNDDFMIGSLSRNH